jgi:predicted nucleic acid-binding protein
VQRSAEAVQLLKRQPDMVVGLTRYRTILRDLRQARIDILPLTHRDLHASRVYREQHGLLVNDSLIVAVMQRERMQFLATNDSDFERVPGIAVYMPTSWALPIPVRNIVSRRSFTAKERRTYCS